LPNAVSNSPRSALRAIWLRRRSAVGRRPRWTTNVTSASGQAWAPSWAARASAIKHRGVSDARGLPDPDDRHGPAGLDAAKRLSRCPICEGLCARCCSINYAPRFEAGGFCVDRSRLIAAPRCCSWGCCRSAAAARSRPSSRAPSNFGCGPGWRRSHCQGESIRFIGLDL